MDIDSRPFAYKTPLLRPTLIDYAVTPNPEELLKMYTLSESSVPASSAVADVEEDAADALTAAVPQGVAQTDQEDTGLQGVKKQKRRLKDEKITLAVNDYRVMIGKRIQLFRLGIGKSQGVQFKLSHDKIIINNW